MKNLIVTLFSLFLLVSCFKDKPFSEFSKVAGSWKIDKLIVQNFDSIGQKTDEISFEENGYMLLTYNEGESAQNTFTYSVEADLAANSLIFYTIGITCDRWDVSVGAKHVNFGYFDPVSNGTVQVESFTISKLKSRKMNWMQVSRHPSGAIARMETVEMSRGN